MAYGVLQFLRHSLAIQRLRHQIVDVRGDVASARSGVSCFRTRIDVDDLLQNSLSPIVAVVGVRGPATKSHQPLSTGNRVFVDILDDRSLPLIILGRLKMIEGRGAAGRV